MMSPLYNMLMTSAMADKAKAELTLDLLSNYPAGIGDHSTEDFYKNAEDALRMLIDAEERIEILNKTFIPQKQII
jgi:hypothetical protein